MSFIKNLVFASLLLLTATFSSAQLKANVWVNKATGSDATAIACATPCLESKPAATIDKARQLVDTLCAGATSALSVMIRVGTYYQADSLAAPLVLSGNTSAFPSTSCQGDNGKSATVPIIYQNYPGEIVAISGGTRITNFTTTGYTCGGTCLQYKSVWNGPYIEGLWYNDERRFRPRVSAVAGTLYSSYKKTCTAGTCGGKGALVDSTDACSISTNGCNGATNATCTVYPATTSCWDRIRVPAGILAQWANLTAASHSGYPACDVEFIYWESFTVPVMRACAVDLVNNILIFSASFSTNSTVGGNYGPLDNHRFIILNEKDDSVNAITLPKQMFLDTTVNPPILYYNAELGEVPNTAKVEVPSLKHALLTYNLENVIFRGNPLSATSNTGGGLYFELDNYQIPAVGFTTSTAVSAFVPGAVSNQNDVNVNFESVRVWKTTGGGLEYLECRVASDPSWCYLGTLIANATTSNSNIVHSNFLDIGEVAIQVGNRGVVATDTDATTASTFTIDDNLTDGVGRVLPTPGINTGIAHDIFITHNEVFDTYHGGLIVCSTPCTWGTANSHGTYNVNTVLNKIHSITQGVTPDIGALYYSIGAGFNSNASTSGTSGRITQNLVYDVNDNSALPGGDAQANGGDGIYLDNMTAFMAVWGNVVWRVSGACIKMTTGVGFSTSGTGSVGWHVFQNNILAYCRGNAIQHGKPSAWSSTQDFTPAGNCAVGQANTIRLMFVFKDNVVWSDRNHASPGAGGYTFQDGCADSCGNTPFTKYQLYVENQWWNTSVTLSTYAKAFHVSHATASPIGPGSGTCAASAAGWDFATPANWQSGAAYTDNAGAGSTPVVTSAGEDVGASFTDPGFISPGYPNDNYRLTCAIGIPGFSCAMTNFAMDNAGRYTNKTFLPTVIQTFPTATFDAAHTNNGEF